MKQGIVGRTIAQRLAELGYTVIMGTRSVKETLAREIDYGTGAFSFSTWRDRHQERIILHSIAEAASGDKIICNCRKGLPWVAALECAGSANLRAKIVVDIANPLDFSRGAPPTLGPCNTDSPGELIQQTFPEARVVKTLNMMNGALMVNPALLSGNHTVFVSGNDSSAKDTAKALLEAFGWKRKNSVDLDDINPARARSICCRSGSDFTDC